MFLLFQALLRFPQIQTDFGITRSPPFESPGTCLPLQAAEILAWRSRKQLRGTDFTKELIPGVPQRKVRSCRFFSAAELAKYIPEITAKYEATNWEGPPGGFILTRENILFWALPRRKKHDIVHGLVPIVTLSPQDLLLLLGGIGVVVLVVSARSAHSKEIQALQEKVRNLQGDGAVQKQALARLESHFINHVNDFTRVRHLRQSDEELKPDQEAAK